MAEALVPLAQMVSICFLSAAVALPAGNVGCVLPTADLRFRFLFPRSLEFPLEERKRLAPPESVRILQGAGALQEARDDLRAEDEDDTVETRSVQKVQGTVFQLFPVVLDYHRGAEARETGRCGTRP